MIKYKYIRMFWISVLFVAISFSASAATQTMVYDVYAGGIHVLEATVVIKTAAPGGKYSITLDAKTFGFLAKLVPWKGIFESGGRVKKNNVLSPEYHRSTAWWRDEYERKDYKYGPNGRFLGLSVTEKKGDEIVKKNQKEKLDTKTLADGTTDALSGTLEVLMKIGVGEKCENKSEIFDGKRRFRQTFSDKGTDDLKNSSYNVFKGPARICEVEVHPVAGAWSKKPRGWMSVQEQGRQSGALPTLWAGIMTENALAAPVKIRIKTTYGTLMMHLAEYRAGDAVMVAQKRLK